MTDRELDEIEASARAARERWELDDPSWLAAVLDLAGNRVRELVAELRLLPARVRRLAKQSPSTLDEELAEYLRDGSAG